MVCETVTLVDVCTVVAVREELALLDDRIVVIDADVCVCNCWLRVDGADAVMLILTDREATFTCIGDACPWLGAANAVGIAVL